MQAVESDVDTPDARLQVKFYKGALKSEYQTEIQGRPIFFDADCVTIMIPGDDKTIIDTIVNEKHKRRFPLQWAHYLNTQGKEEKIIGTPINNWDRLTPSQIEELRAFKFFTVDSIATASDLQLQKIGMIAGVSPYVLRDQARKYVHINPHEAAAEVGSRVEQLEAENLRIKNEMDEKLHAMQMKLEELLEGSQKKVVSIVSVPEEIPEEETSEIETVKTAVSVKEVSVKPVKRRGRTPSKK